MAGGSSTWGGGKGDVLMGPRVRLKVKTFSDMTLGSTLEVGDGDLELVSPALISIGHSANSLISSSTCISSALTHESYAGE